MLRALGWLVLTLVCVTACSSRTTEGATDLAAQADQTFRDVCSKCHGQEGRGGVPITDGGPPPRDFTDRTWQASRSDAELVAVITAGKPPMPAFGALLSPPQIDAVVAKIRRLGMESKR